MEGIVVDNGLHWHGKNCKLNEMGETLETSVSAGSKKLRIKFSKDKRPLINNEPVKIPENRYYKSDEQNLSPSVNSVKKMQLNQKEVSYHDLSPKVKNMAA